MLYFRIVHGLLTLKIEGTAPHSLTFTFGSDSRVDGRPFLVTSERREPGKMQPRPFVSFPGPGPGEFFLLRSWC